MIDTTRSSFFFPWYLPQSPWSLFTCLLLHFFSSFSVSSISFLLSLLSSFLVSTCFNLPDPCSHVYSSISFLAATRTGASPTQDTICHKSFCRKKDKKEKERRYWPHCIASGGGQSTKILIEKRNHIFLSLKWDESGGKSWVRQKVEIWEMMRGKRSFKSVFHLSWCISEIVTLIL